MSVTGASDGSGSGLSKYLFFVDNNSTNATQVNADSTGKKTYSYTTTTGYHTCHVSAVDKTGNSSDTKSFAEGRTKLYAYEVYKKTLEWDFTWSSCYAEVTYYNLNSGAHCYANSYYWNHDYQPGWIELVYNLPEPCVYKRGDCILCCSNVDRKRGTSDGNGFK